MQNTVGNHQTFDGLSKRVKQLYERYGVVPKDIGSGRHFFDLDKLYYHGINGAAEYISLLAEYLAALKSHHAIKDFDTLMVTKEVELSPLLAGTFLAIIEEHNKINPQVPIKHGLVYVDWLESPTTLLQFRGLNLETKYDGILILYPGEHSFSRVVPRAMSDLKRIGLSYLDEKPNLRGVVQVIDHEDGFDTFIQEIARKKLGYQVNYHKILSISDFGK